MKAGAVSNAVPNDAARGFRCLEQGLLARDVIASVNPKHCAAGGTQLARFAAAFLLPASDRQRTRDAANITTVPYKHGSRGTRMLSRTVVRKDATFACRGYTLLAEIWWSLLSSAIEGEF
ncbi:hypothetical protein MTO96_005846 [Rhipicephalus appendiculatus]